MLRLAKKAARLLNASKALSSIPKSVKKVASMGEPLLRPKNSIDKHKNSVLA